ncbi:ABC transporter ATP-binding protein [Roseibium sp. M-1]
MIRLENLSKIFETERGPIVAVDKVSLEVPAGEICVLLGPSGCGKTTTMKMINRLISPSGGKVFVDGQDTDGVDPIRLRRSIGYVIQQIGLFPNKTIEDNICIVPDLLGWDRSKSRRRACELLDMVGMKPDQFLRRYPRELSGGQQQRVGVIRALAADTPVMLMDEPFGAIDPINREVIQNEFLRMQETIRKTIIFVSHDLDEAVRMADRIAIFRAGKLEQFDPPAHLLASPRNDFIRDFLGTDAALKRLLLVNVRDAMQSAHETVRPGMNAVQARAVIDRTGTDKAVVIDGNGRPLGMVSREKVKQAEIIVSDVLEPLRATIAVSDDLRNATALMFTHDMPVLPCLDENGELQGVLTYGAIVRSLSRQEAAA